VDHFQGFYADLPLLFIASESLKLLTWIGLGKRCLKIPFIHSSMKNGQLKNEQG
jgi:hypothetical protein